MPFDKNIEAEIRKNFDTAISDTLQANAAIESYLCAVNNLTNKNPDPNPYSLANYLHMMACALLSLYDFKENNWMSDNIITMSLEGIAVHPSLLPGNKIACSTLILLKQIHQSLPLVCIPNILMFSVNESLQKQYSLLLERCCELCGISKDAIILHVERFDFEIHAFMRFVTDVSKSLREEKLYDGWCFLSHNLEKIKDSCASCRRHAGQFPSKVPVLFEIIHPYLYCIWPRLFSEYCRQIIDSPYPRGYILSWIESINEENYDYYYSALGICGCTRSSNDVPEQQIRDPLCQKADYICPITRGIMQNPVTDSEGHTFEKEAIQEWLETNPTCPLDRRPLRLTDLTPNHDLRNEIQEWYSHKNLKLEFTM